MITLGEFLNLVDNFYCENSLIKVFDVKRISDESDCLADDTIGCVFGVCVGEAKNFLNSTYENAEIMSIYICEMSELKVLVDTHIDSESNAQMDKYDARIEKIISRGGYNENSDSV